MPRRTLLSLFTLLHVSPAFIQIVFAVAIGVAAAFGSSIFTWLIHESEHLFFDIIFDRLLAGRLWTLLFIPALGGLLVGPLVYFFAREAKGHGVPEVMTAVIKRGGRIRPIVAIVKSVASAITIGSGGSAGSEGPIVQIGAAFGSTLGQIFKMPPKRIKTFVGCGAAGGIAAIFNAPIAGVLFSMEVILGEFETFSFIYLVIASTTSAAISQWLRGAHPVFDVMYFSSGSSWELIAFALLGVLAGLTARAFISILTGFENFFDHKLKLPEYLKASFGGILLGILAIFTVRAFGCQPGPGGITILGVGYESISLATEGHLFFFLLLALLALKLLATCLCLGSGGSGGVFAPSLYMGAMLGGAFGFCMLRIPGMIPRYTALMETIAQHPAAPPGLDPRAAILGVYALVGMGAVFAGAAHAPITAIFILFEMTGYHYQILLPIMTCAVVSTLVSKLMSRDSIYTIKLRQKGIITDADRPHDILESMVVRDIMITDVHTINETMTLKELAAVFGSKLHTSLPVVDKNDKLAGIVTYKEMHKAMTSGKSWGLIKVSDCMRRDIVTAFPDETMDSVFGRMRNAYISIAPVVKRRDPGKIVGIITYRHIFDSYQRALMI